MPLLMYSTISCRRKPDTCDDGDDGMEDERGCEESEGARYKSMQRRAGRRETLAGTAAASLLSVSRCARGRGGAGAAGRCLGRLGDWGQGPVADQRAQLREG